MQHSLSDIRVSHSVDVTLKELRTELAKVVGITLIGNRITLRFGKGKELKEVHAIILEVDDGTSCDYCGESHDIDFCQKEEDDTIPQ